MKNSWVQPSDAIHENQNLFIGKSTRYRSACHVSRSEMIYSSCGRSKRWAEQSKRKYLIFSQNRQFNFIVANCKCKRVSFGTKCHYHMVLMFSLFHHEFDHNAGFSWYTLIRRRSTQTVNKRKDILCDNMEEICLHSSGAHRLSLGCTWFAHTLITVHSWKWPN